MFKESQDRETDRGRRTKGISSEKNSERELDSEKQKGKGNFAYVRCHS